MWFSELFFQCFQLVTGGIGFRFGFGFGRWLSMHLGTLASAMLATIDLRVNIGREVHWIDSNSLDRPASHSEQASFYPVCLVPWGACLQATAPPPGGSILGGASQPSQFSLEHDPYLFCL